MTCNLTDRFEKKAGINRISAFWEIPKKNIKIFTFYELYGWMESNLWCSYTRARQDSRLKH